MAEPSNQSVVDTLLRRHGRTFAEELGIAVEKNLPSPLFRLLCAVLLFSARIRTEIAAKAANALAAQGWRTAEKMAASSWEDRVETLNQAGYARYDESTARMLGDTAQLLLDRYDGDLRNLRQAAGRDPKKERQLLKECKGIGDVGVDIFFREVQVAWDELFPYADKRALESAHKLGLPQDPEQLVKIAGKDDYPRLVAALVRVRLADDYDDVLAVARQS